MKLFKFVAASLGALTLASQAFACSCLFQETAEQQFDKAEILFIGTVVDTGPRQIKRAWWHWFTPWDDLVEPEWDAEHVTTFQIDRMLKGPETLDTITFVHGVSSAACGIRFETQQAGVFIGYTQSDGYYSTSLCSSARFSESEFIAVAAAKN